MSITIGSTKANSKGIDDITIGTTAQSIATAGIAIGSIAKSRVFPQ